MSDVMSPISFGQLLNWIMVEYKKYGTVFGERRPYKGDPKFARTIFCRMLETPVGAAAGPHTQLAQNIVAAYYTGSRFFELKTVQVMDGAQLAACVNKPCIKAEDECYNCEWSTELYVSQAMEEYIKAWFLLKVLAKEFGLGSMDGFQFNISVGYDLEGIKSPKIDHFLNTMKNAGNSEIFQYCRQHLLGHLSMFEKITKEDIEGIQGEICNSVTISTLHGCPPQEIEKIAMYLIVEKGFHTFIKCNPTLLGYEFARKTMDDMGYDYVAFGDFHFKDDLQYQDAVPMLTRLMDVCREKNLEFGVKITNTFPVDVKNHELPSDEMYMSGRPLYPLSISLAAKLAEEFSGRLRISYSGGADFYNIKGIVDAGIWPVTVATTLLKPGGYERMAQIAGEVEEEGVVFKRVNETAAKALAEAAQTSPRHIKGGRPDISRKIRQTVPLLDCFMAPCEEGCPIHQDITAYLQLAGEGRYVEAMQVIAEKNPLPFITGTICAHNCMGKCTRNFYEEPVHIRAVKLKIAKEGYRAWLQKVTPAPITEKGRAAVIGGGPAGMSAAYFLRKAGMEVTLFEKSDSLGGVVRHSIPEFRIPGNAIDKDVAILQAVGVDIRYGTKIENAEKLKEEGYTAVIFAVGAYKPGVLELKEGEAMNALCFLRKYKKSGGKLDIGRQVAVIGGGNTAMDTARAAKRISGVEKVFLVYRRTKPYMPADYEELLLAEKDGVEILELLAPVKFSGKLLDCRVMRLREYDESGRRGVVGTEEIRRIPADTVIAAVGEKVPEDLYKANKIHVNEWGRAVVNQETCETNQPGIYVVGDGLGGPATVAEGIRDGRKAAEAIVGRDLADDYSCDNNEERIYGRKGTLKGAQEGAAETGRCLSCSAICENCTEVCPNRANISVRVPGMEKHQIIHIDSMCNECGNCRSFCPYDSAPYLDKFTVFASERDMEESKNQGFAVLDKDNVTCAVRYLGERFSYTKGEETRLPEGLKCLIEAVVKEYPYILP